jgi:hypothetical protein
VFGGEKGEGRKEGTEGGKEEVRTSAAKLKGGVSGFVRGGEGLSSRLTRGKGN